MYIKYFFVKILYFLFIVFLTIGCTMPIKAPTIKSTLSPAYMQGKYTRIAVYVNDNRDDSLRHIEEEFIKALIRKNYIIPARSDLSLILKEQDFQGSGITDKAAVNLGKLIDVQAIIIVNMHNKEAEISARMIDVENGEIVWIGKTNSGPYYFAKARYLASMIPPAEDPRNIFKEEWDYNKAEGYFVSKFNWGAIDKIIVQVKGLSKEKAYMLEDDIIAKLMENGYRVPSRSNIEAIIREHNFNTSMLSDQALTSLGKLSNTNAMMIVWMGQITKISDKPHPVVSNNKIRYHYGCSCAVRVIDLEKSKIIWSGTLFADGWYWHHDQLKELNDQLTKRLVESGLIPKKM